MYVTQGLHRAVQQTPELPATIFQGRVRTWAESADRVARLAGALRALGVGRGGRVAMLALNSDRYHEYLFAVPWADAVLNPVNIRWSPAEIAYSLIDSETRVLIVDDAYAPMVPELRDRYDELTTVIYSGEGPAPEGMLSFEDLISSHEPVDDVYRGGDELAGIFYTGGTTGAPKGVMLGHAALVTSALGFAACGNTITRGGILLHAAPMFHLADIGAWNSRNLVGGTHVFVPMFDPAAVVDSISRYGVTDTLLVPTMIQMLVDSPHASNAELSSVEHLIYGASPISETLLDRVEKVMPAAALVQAYGMTELSPVATVLDADSHRDPTLRRSAGRAAPHADLRIVDDNDADVPRGTVGEVVVRGGHVMLGYWNRPDETTEALRGGWMHTGDGAYMDESGYVFIVDRIKDMIVTGGENVYSAEVENALAQHPAVAQCAVIGVPDPDWGERVHAVVVKAPDAQVTADELREHAKTLIAGYKAPRSVEFADALPVSGAGKILKRELRKKHWDDADRQVN